MQSRVGKKIYKCRTSNLPLLMLMKKRSEKIYQYSVVGLLLLLVFALATATGNDRLTGQAYVKSIEPVCVPWEQICKTQIANQLQTQLLLAQKIGINTQEPNAPLEIAKNNQLPALLLTHPDSSDPVWDTVPFSALKIQSPPNPTTRNYVSALWIETNGAQVDKGRGILLNNLGKSDGIYVQQDGASGTGLAILLTPNALSSTGAVIGTLADTQTGLVLRQEVALDPNAKSSSLLTVEADGTKTEMMRLNSNIPDQVGIVSRMFGANAVPFVIKNNLNQDTALVTSAGGAYFSGKVGIGTKTPETNLHVNNILKLTPTDSPSSCPVVGKGSIYFDNDMNEPCFCDGTSWKQFDGGGSC